MTFHYAAGGKLYAGKVKTRTPYEEGDPLTVRYNPRDPEVNNHDAEAQNMRRAALVFCSVLAMVALAVLLLKLA